MRRKIGAQGVRVGQSGFEYLPQSAITAVELSEALATASGMRSTQTKAAWHVVRQCRNTRLVTKSSHIPRVSASGL